ncbi:Nramp family divalent metal transporter [candidate division KSB1 bacterium]
MIKRIWKSLLAVGPGLFCIGYTIGTGSVTSMAKAGSQYGMRLLWVLALSCLFSWVLMEAYGRYAVVSGKTAIYSFKTCFKFGKFIAILTVIGVVIGQWFALSGIVGLSAHAVYEGLQLFVPELSSENYWAVLSLAIIIIVVMYGLICIGNYSFFEKVLVFFVTIMGLCFIASIFIVFPSPGEIARGFIPSIPNVEGATLMVAAFVGTTMAAPTFVVRPLLMKGKGWTSVHIKEQSRDSFIAALFMFVISGSIMICATGVLYYRGHVILKVLDMVRTLEPVAGKFAVVVFLVGTLSAGLSSIFPIIMVAPLLIADYRAGELDTNSKLFRILAGVGCLFGLIVPILSINPIIAQITTQVAIVFILPIVIFGITYIINRREYMGEHKSGIFLNIGLLSAFVFSCFISYTAVLALKDLFGI